VAALTIGGRTLDPAFQAIAEGAAAAAADAPPAPLTPEGMRAQTDGLVGAMGGQPEPGVTWDSVAIPADGRSIPARLYKPAKQDPKAALIVFYHFGGGVIGTIETCHCFCTILAKEIGAPVLSIEYRLAPEHRFPAGIDDAIVAYEWGAANAAKFGAPANKAAVGGDSMGGNFSAIVAQEMKRKGKAQPVAQLLIYPALDVASTLPSMTTFGEAFPLNAATMHWFMENYMNKGDDPNNPRLSPLRDKDVSGLAPAFIYTAGFDPLCDEGDEYAKKLRAAGAKPLYRCYDALAHAFTAFTGVVPAADVACREIAREFGAAIKA
jgi:acetyl esterase